MNQTEQAQRSEDVLAQAKAFAAPLLSARLHEQGEALFAHAEASAQILAEMGAGLDTQAASYLVYTTEYLSKPLETIGQAFGEAVAQLAVQTQQIMQIQRQAKLQNRPDHAHNPLLQQTENVRKMLLAFSRDVRVVVLRLASRLQTLRFAAASKQAPSRELATESLQVFAPLANRLGLGNVKWEMEDLAFRFLEPDTYQDIAKRLQAKRSERETHLQSLMQDFNAAMRSLHIQAEVAGRPKHIYSIVKKMRAKNLAFHQVMDISALRIITAKSEDCYAVLAWLHAHYPPVDGEFDDYIAKPKSNGYQSLHTVVLGQDGKPVEVQIRSQAMHQHAELGVAAHWAYKEAGSKGYAGYSAAGAYEQKIGLLRQLLAWEREVNQSDTSGLFDDRIYVLTPDASVVELAQGATPIDFAYAVHTKLGHRCRGAKVDGVLVALSTPLQNGQTVEISALKEGAPSRDWLNPELGFIATHRARAKVRAWFNTQAHEQTVARGREQVEKTLQREGKTAVKLDELALSLGCKNAEQLFELVGKDELSLRQIEQVLRPAPASSLSEDELLLQKANAAKPLGFGAKTAGKQGSSASAKAAAKGSSKASAAVLVDGISSLLTQLAGCCKPVPPDDISGFVTRGKGISVHRSQCPAFLRLLEKDQGRDSGRIIAVAWSASSSAAGGHFAVDIKIFARDRQGLLRDISEIFAKAKISVTGARTQTSRDQDVAMRFSIQIANLESLQHALQNIAKVEGVLAARRA